MPPTGIIGLFLAAVNIGQVSAIFGIISILFGLLILWKPNIISYLLAIYLILIGLGSLLSAII
ncbi:hypothetical protein A3K64_01305 [Candidatus Micrarchaeota archaeon RBG_16_36_9]|nr:MAG: hypothetical protein A3K64_01305 [Candidatus Micrarchaeota archaeon RBG_16_36_9]